MNKSDLIIRPLQNILGKSNKFKYKNAINNSIFLKDCFC